MTGQSGMPTRRMAITGALGLGALGGVSLLATPSAEAALGDPTIPTSPGTKFFLRVDTIQGDSTDVGFVNQIHLLTWGWGLSNPTDPVVIGTGAGAGKATRDDFVFVGRAGLQSPKLVGALNGSRVIPRILLSCVRPGGSPFTYLTIEFDEAIISSYDITPDGQDGTPIEIVHVKYAKIIYKFIPQKPDGSVATPIATTWNYKTNSTT